MSILRISAAIGWFRAALSIAFLVILVLYYAIAPANAQQQCVSMAEVAGNLKSQYGEVPAAGGVMTSAGAPLPMMIIANSATGSWTVLIVTANGCAQIAAAGEDWILAAPSEPVAPGEET